MRFSRWCPDVKGQVARLRLRGPGLQDSFKAAAFSGPFYSRLLFVRRRACHHGKHLLKSGEAAMMA